MANGGCPLCGAATSSVMPSTRDSSLTASSSRPSLRWVGFRGFWWRFGCFLGYLGGVLEDLGGFWSDFVEFWVFLWLILIMREFPEGVVLLQK